MIRRAEEIPARLNSLTLTVFAGTAIPELAHVKFEMPEINENPYEEKYLVDVVKEKTGLDKLSFKKITKAGLSLVSNLSKEKFNYETNPEGDVTELKYDSRILAFSIPTKKVVDVE
jgi:hypothetical protein